VSLTISQFKIIRGATAVPRTRSKDYDGKKQQILDVAASMFAEVGYKACKMEDIAERCNVSKSMLYHYFKRKEDVLFEIVYDHVVSLNGILESYLANADASNKHAFFGRFLEKYLQKSTPGRERHAVTIRDTRWLTPEQLAKQETLERKNADLIVQILKKVNPNYTGREYKVYAFLLIGMINWIELWYSSRGTMTRPELYDRISVLFLDGFLTGYRESKASLINKLVRKRETVSR
jgi:AcrR family transcriptional regulator